jgi:hypothetical protein
MDTTFSTSTFKVFAEPPEQRPRAAKRLKSLLSFFPRRQLGEKLDRLITRYRTLSPEVKEAAANREAKEIIEEVRQRIARRQPLQSDLAKVERALLTMMSGNDLRRHAWLLREEFHKTIEAVPADQTLLHAYQSSKPPTADTADEASLRADLLALQAQLQDICATRRTQIRARNKIACSMVLLSALAIYIALQLDKILKIEGTIVFDVFGVGMLGGVFSTLLRIQKFKLGGNYEAAALSQPGNQVTVILAPVIGGVGAILLFVMLAAGVLKGSLLPDLPLVSLGLSADALESLFQLHLASSAESAKLYLLCFLAGFSERLVPDVISRLTASTLSKR